MTPPDPLLPLTHEVGQMRGRGAMPDFGDFLRDWRAVRLSCEGSRILSLWHGPEQARLTVLCDSAPNWHVLSVAEYGLSEVWAHPTVRFFRRLQGRCGRAGSARRRAMKAESPRFIQSKGAPSGCQSWKCPSVYMRLSP